jgi:hypothetical protein
VTLCSQAKSSSFWFLLLWDFTRRRGGLEHPQGTHRVDVEDVGPRVIVNTSRSNWAKESSTLRVSRPMLDVVLNDWVIDTNDTPG